VGVAAGAREEAEKDREGALRHGEVAEREEAAVQGERRERRRVREEEVGEERREEGRAGREEREEKRRGVRRLGEEEAREVGHGRGEEWRGGAARRREEAEGHGKGRGVAGAERDGRTGELEVGGLMTLRLGYPEPIQKCSWAGLWSQLFFTFHSKKFNFH